VSVTDAQIAEWRANPHAGEHPAVVPALIAELERLREQLRPLDGSEYAVVMGTRTFEERILERDALRAEIERLTKERDAWEARSREQARMLADNFGKFDR
jgi:hypothetical protein